MAANRRPTCARARPRTGRPGTDWRHVARRGQRGGTILGFLAGLILGLAIAVAVAIFVTRAPVPFVNKVGKASDRIAEPKSADSAPDPNKPLYGKTKPPPGSEAATAPSGPLATAPAEAPAPASLPPTTAPEPTAPQSSAPAAGEPGRAPEDRTTYLLQAGAFRSHDDADGMKAKLALIGFEARVLQAEINGQTLYRVRIGPFAQLDDLNRVRAKLAESGIEASVVRQR